MAYSNKPGKIDSGFFTKAFNDGTLIQVIPLTKKPQAINLQSWDTSAFQSSSMGQWSDTAGNFCVQNQNSGYFPVDQLYCIALVNNVGDGWTGQITGTSDTDFTITWIRRGNGMNLSIRWQSF